MDGRTADAVLIDRLALVVAVDAAMCGFSKGIEARQPGAETLGHDGFRRDLTGFGIRVTGRLMTVAMFCNHEKAKGLFASRGRVLLEQGEVPSAGRASQVMAYKIWLVKHTTYKAGCGRDHSYAYAG